GGEHADRSEGRAGPHLATSPCRECKHLVHEGGISTPLIVRWPAGLPAGVQREQPHQLPDVMATVLDAAGVPYPAPDTTGSPLPLEGVSMLPTLREGAMDPDRTLYWEHEGNCAVRRGRWKLVKKHAQPWELYDMTADRTELHDMAGEHPELVADLSADYESWAQRCGVVPREKVLELYAARGGGLPSE